MLTSKQKKYLRGQSHQIQPIFQVGKAGVNENMTTQISEALEKRELIKVSILQNCFEDNSVVADEVIHNTEADLVQLIGNTIILYKESKNNKQIDLP
ncbi:ribosome assembly RNA-binding protein YhbY [Halobacillus amylolyticus]|uniref:Ribosome assembly RNA-binding protein YhbY n=1 Tax=Halobacillus amylolyticus TaxID=2932259 RepID=A0ABY4HFN9_9BACI|nr:ribosome assembly RNA-binding protein YhbY [Halobacillus amylolyticus]UOR12245.1 ribosome assembly RNA-binding protein YhbY [Halobacillus amylolyticus]